MKIKNRFFALLVLCLSYLLFFSCAKVDDAASASGINEYGDLNDGYVYIPVGLGLSVDDGESTRTLKNDYSCYLTGYDYVMYYGPEDEPRKYSCDVKLEQSETSFEGVNKTKYANILLQIKEQDLEKKFCFSLVGERSFEATPEGWKISSKGKIITDKNSEGIESITLSKSTATFSLNFTIDTIDSLGDEGAKGQFRLNFNPTIYRENYHVIVLLCKEVDGEYVEVYGKHFESADIDKTDGVYMDSPMIECGQYLIKIYAYVPEEDEEEGGKYAGKCFGMYSSILEIYGGYNEYYYVDAGRIFETYHVVSTAPDYSVAKAKADELEASF